MSDKKRFPIDVELVRNLVASQFPEWAHLAVNPVAVQGNDNQNFRLGDRLSVRLPSAPWYATGIDKEQRWLPRLAQHLPLPIPVPIALGQPCEIYPCHWSVYLWLEGETAAVAPVTDRAHFAVVLAEFLVALRKIDGRDGPAAGAHSFFRGASLGIYDEQTRTAIDALKAFVDSDTATEVWEVALASSWSGPSVWFHGDVATTNLLVRYGRLAAVIDFDCCGVGDPACDLTIAWTFFNDEARAAFKSASGLDEATWARGRGWALWKALIVDAGQHDGKQKPTIWTHNPTTGRSIVEEVLADYRCSR